MLSKFEWIPNSRENITNNKINCLSRFANCGWSRVGGAVTSLMIARFVSKTIKRLIKEIYRLSKQQLRAKNKSPHDTTHARAPNVAKKRSYTKRSRSEISESSIDFSSLKNKCVNSRFTELPKSCANFPSKHRQKVADAVSRFAIDEPKNKTIPKLFVFRLFSLSKL